MPYQAASIELLVTQPAMQGYFGEQVHHDQASAILNSNPESNRIESCQKSHTIFQWQLFLSEFLFMNVEDFSQSHFLTNSNYQLFSHHCSGDCQHNIYSAFHHAFEVMWIEQNVLQKRQETSVFLSKMLLSQTGTAVLSCEFSSHLGCRHDQKIGENRTPMVIPLDCKFQIVRLKAILPFRCLEQILQ